MHGTTVATNAILQRRGARVGPRHHRRIPGPPRDRADEAQPPRPLQPAVRPARSPRSRARSASRSPSASCTTAPSSPAGRAGGRAALRPAAAARGRGGRRLLPAPRTRTPTTSAGGRALRAALPGVPVSLSSEVVPEYREFERFSTTVFNAYIRPAHGPLPRVAGEAALAAGYPPGASTVGSSGGAMTVDAARRLPIKTIVSGPAGGVSQAVFLGRGDRRAGPHHLRHGGNEHGRLPHSRPAAGHHGQAPRRLPRQDPADRHQERGRRRRQHRVARRRRPAPGRAAVGGRRSGARPATGAGDRGHRERREPRPRAPGRRAAARGGDRLDASLARAGRSRGWPTRLGGYDLTALADGIVRIMVARMVVVDPRDHDPARPRSRAISP